MEFYSGRRGPSVEVLFEPRYLWAGVYWEDQVPCYRATQIDLYICAVPCLALRVTFFRYPAEE